MAAHTDILFVLRKRRKKAKAFESPGRKQKVHALINIFFPSRLPFSSLSSPFRRWLPHSIVLCVCRSKAKRRCSAHRRTQIENNGAKKKDFIPLRLVIAGARLTCQTHSKRSDNYDFHTLGGVFVVVVVVVFKPPMKRRASIAIDIWSRTSFLQSYLGDLTALKIPVHLQQVHSWENWHPPSVRSSECVCGNVFVVTSRRDFCVRAHLCMPNTNLCSEFESCSSSNYFVCVFTCCCSDD